MADRKTHVIRLTAVGDPDTFIDVERIDSFTTTQSQPDHWLKIITRLDWGDGSVREVYGPGDLSAEMSTTPDVIVEGPGPAGTTREVDVIDVPISGDSSQVVKIGVVKQITGIESGYGYQKETSLFNTDQQTDSANSTRTSSPRRVLGSDGSSFVDQQFLGTFTALEHGTGPYQKAITKLDNQYLLDAFAASPSDAHPVSLDPFQNIINVGSGAEWLIIGHIALTHGDPTGTAVAYDFNTPKLPSTITLYATGTTGDWSSYPPQDDDIVYSDTPTPSMGPLTTWTSPDVLMEFTLNSVTGETRNAQIGYTAIKLGAAAATGATTLDFFVRTTSPGGGPASKDVTQGTPTALPEADFISTYPLWFTEGNVYELSNVSGPLVNDLVDLPYFGEIVYFFTPPAVFSETGGKFSGLVQIATVGKVSSFLRPEDSSLGVAVYTSRTFTEGRESFRVLTEQDPSDQFYPHWRPDPPQPGYGARGTGDLTVAVTQDYQDFTPETSAPPPPDNNGMGTDGTGPAPPIDYVHQVSVDLATNEITITQISGP